MRGEGAEWMGQDVPRFLASGHAAIVAIVDIYHAEEHRGTVAKAVFGPDTRAAVA